MKGGSETEIKESEGRTGREARLMTIIMIPFPFFIIIILFPLSAIGDHDSIVDSVSLVVFLFFQGKSKYSPCVREKMGRE
jgi:hypothetical protein